MKLIDCRQLQKTYADKQVLNGVNFAVKQGEFFGLVGVNGCGKSTLIKCILNLCAIDAGSITLSGHSHYNDKARHFIAYLPDQFSLPVWLKTSDFLYYMLKLHNVPRQDKVIHAMLASLGLETHVLSLSVKQLSKGMAQKIGLAVCLLSRKPLLILDEPMSGLDPEARVLLKRQLQIAKQNGISIFFSSHILADVDELADTMAVLHHAKMRFTGSPDIFKEDYQGETLEQAYMNCIG